MKMKPLLLAFLENEMDWSGIYGGIFHYSMVLAIVGSAFLAFLYFWSKGRLDMDEEPKIKMMQEQEERDGR